MAAHASPDPGMRWSLGRILVVVVEAARAEANDGESLVMSSSSSSRSAAARFDSKRRTTSMDGVAPRSGESGGLGGGDRGWLWWPVVGRGGGHATGREERERELDLFGK